MKVLITNGT